jgi:tRNA 2-thiouridine synthesizing protein A
MCPSGWSSTLPVERPAEKHEFLDLRGLKCPLTALFARRALLRSGPGAPVIVRADDPMARVDIPHMCHQEGFEVLSIRETAGATELILRRPSA